MMAFDFRRMFLGDESALFLLEIAFRTVVIYAFTLMLIRWVGSRSVAQLSLVEFLLVIALGSAVGDAMFYPDVPLVHCMLVITMVILMDKGLSHLMARSPKLEDVIEGKSATLVRDGIIDCSELRRLNVGHDELFEQLRLRDVENLAQVRAAYLETNGAISAFKIAGRGERPGLSIEPPWDVDEPRRFRSGEAAPQGGHYACRQCGTVIESEGAPLPDCCRCEGTVWHLAR